MRNSTRAARRGITITEVVVSLGMLSALGTLVAQWLVVTSAQQAREQEHRLAAQTATNLMEQLFAQPWDKLTQENSAALATLTIDSENEDLQCSVEITAVEPDETRLECKRIHVRVSHAAARFPPVDLMAWRHAREPRSEEERP
jgi:type II secretory pathway pseudopilin PulG